MESNFIQFVEGKPKPKTKTWKVYPVGLTEGADVLGWIKWYSHWRQYNFFPDSSTTFNYQCLRDIADFCEAKTKEHKKKQGKSWATK